MKPFLYLALIYSGFGVAQVPTRQLVWEENFNGSTIDETAWAFDLGNGCPSICGWGNNERQFYTKDNYKVGGGFLTIQARKQGDRYTSTKIKTKNRKEFKYGRIEARAKLPTGHGIWPAFWMLGSNIEEKGWPKCGEIDILEYVGKEPHQLYTTLHTQQQHGDNANSKKTEISNIEQGFHLYAVDWSPEQMVFYFDDKKVFTVKVPQRTEDQWPFDQPFFIVVNMAVGGNFGGPDVDDSIFPQDFVIDYIKVYQ